MLVEHELMLFAGLFFLIGIVDELAVDLIWLWLRLTKRASTKRTSPDKWHCSQMESRRREWSFRGFTSFAWSVDSPWQRAHCIPWTISRYMLSVPGSVRTLVAWQ